MTETRDDVLSKTPEGQRAELEALDRAIREAAPSLAPSAGGGTLGYGHYRYRYATGREGASSALTLAPRASNLTLYIGAAGVERWAIASRRAPAAGAASGSGRPPTCRRTCS